MSQTSSEGSISPASSKGSLSSTSSEGSLSPTSSEGSISPASSEGGRGSGEGGSGGRGSVSACYRKSLPIAYALSLLTLIILVETGGGYLFWHLLPNAGELEALWATAFLRLVDFGLILFFVYLSRQGLSAIGLAPGEWWSGLFKGLLWSFGFGLIVFTIWGIFLLFHINLFQYLVSSPPDHFWWILFIGGIFAPIVEDSFLSGDCTMPSGAGLTSSALFWGFPCFLPCSISGLCSWA